MNNNPTEPDTAISPGTARAYQQEEPLVIQEPLEESKLPVIFKRVTGTKDYELTDHLGNVRVVITDHKEAGIMADSAFGFRADIRQMSNYYPGGSIMPGRNYNAGDYRYSYNGFEKDDEIRGVGNHISWGDYGYDPRTLRRWTPDKLQAKYPWQSPYAPVANNPNLNREIDGNDYSVYVDHSTKTVIIKATHYTAKGNTNDHNSAVAATKFWNDQSGKYQYKVGKGKEAVYYDINFQLDVQEVDNPSAEANKDRALFIAETDKLTPDQSSNTYGVLPDTDPTFASKDADKQTEGVTKDGVHISVKESRKSDDTGPHEVGHTLGFGHLIGTVMSEAINVGHTSDVNKIIVGSILSKAGLGKFSYHSDYKSTAKGTLQPSTGGTAPTDFNKGKVVKSKPRFE